MRPETGYVKASEYLYRAFTVCFSLVALALAAPLCVAVAAAILVLDGPPLFYSSVRLGKNKRPFRMYKFRTLVTDAERRIGPGFFEYSLSSNRELLTRTGKFLRETRLDEIPQFVNTLRGDMDLIGPRPMRPEQYERFCRNIPGFDQLFTVRPGLIGYAQIFTPHTTPKRIRSSIDHRFMLRKHLYSSELLLLIVSLMLITVRLAGRVCGGVARQLALLARSRPERRTLDRRRPGGVTVRVRQQGNGATAPVEVPLIDANEEALAVEAAQLPSPPLELELRIPAGTRRGRPVFKTAHCSAEVYASKRDEQRGISSYVLKYRPRTPFNYYIVHQHLMNSSIIRHS